MSFEELSPGAALVAMGPLVLLLFAFVPRGWANRNVGRMMQLATAATSFVMIAALLGALNVALGGRVQHIFAQSGPLQIGVYFDVLSAVIFGLVAFLGAVVVRFALNYLKGDGAQGYFLKWLCATIGAVLLLIVSGNLVMFTLAWIATSLSLHKLLTFYGHRPAALIAARKKFVISRLGDLCLIGAIALTYRIFGTWEFGALFEKAEALRAAGTIPGEATWLCLLLVGGAMMKSAQFPFHSWLPDTMETPTPVSALMHAGIINAGGFLIVRLAPVVSLSPIAMESLALIGAFTALFASLVMMTQASIKRMLAFSTVAQMGFMMLQCGLGAYSIAVLHIVAHSLYKAHAFLTSGSVVSISKSSWVPAGQPASHPGVLASSLGAAVLLTIFGAQFFGVSPLAEPGAVILGAVFVMALTHFLWTLWGQKITARLAVAGLIIGAAVSLAYFALHIGFKSLLAPSPPSEAASDLGLILTVVVIALFGATLVLQAQLPQWSSQGWCRALYVHARNGFYFNTLANRAIQSLWPAK